MLISAQQFAEIVNYLRNKASVSLGSEKRRTTRMELRAKVICTPINDGMPGQRFSVLTRDLSMEGIGLLTAIPIKQGQQFIAMLPRNDAETVFILCDVMHCGVVADGMFALGCRYLKVLTKDLAHKIEDAGAKDTARIREKVLS